MKNAFINKNNGIALITALMMTLISLTIIMAVMSVITKNIQMVGGNKRFKSALEASYGGTELVLKQILPSLLNNSLPTDFSLFTVSYPNDGACSLATKLTSTQSAWNAACNLTDDPKKSPDIMFQLPSATGGQAYTVYAKIVDTLVVGNTDRSEGGSGDNGVVVGGVVANLSGGGGGGGGLTVKQIPYVYRIDIQSERSVNAVEKANLSVLYAY